VSLTLQAINRFPVKSCRAERPDRATVEPWGLRGDRRWMLVDDDGAQVTAREHPPLVLVSPTLDADGSLDLTAPDLAPLHVDVPRPGRLLDVRVWRSALQASLADDAAHAWFSKIVGRSVRLVYLDDPTRRHPSAAFAQPDDLVSLADGYPLLVVTTGSVDALNDLIATGPRADEGPVPVMRFRPNLVVAGSQAWVEDGWRRLRVGAATFRAVKGCDRCVLTTIDPDTAQKGKEPIATLARHRRWDGATWFGMNLIPDNPGVEIAVGDAVEILEAVPAPDGPPR
jgi:MOSC domain-containing protein